MVEDLNEIEVGQIEEASVEFQERGRESPRRFGLSQFGGEDPMQSLHASSGGFDQLMDDARGKTAGRIVCFLHGGTIGAILDHMQGRDYNYRSRPRMPNCSYTVVRETSDDVWTEWSGWHSDHLEILT